MSEGKIVQVSELSRRYPLYPIPEEGNPDEMATCSKVDRIGRLIDGLNEKDSFQERRAINYFRVITLAARTHGNEVEQIYARALALGIWTNFPGLLQSVATVIVILKDET